MRYIGSIQKQNGMLVISGVIGVRRYLWYSKREAIVRYNQECRKKLQPERPSINGVPRFEEGDAVKVISKKSKFNGDTGVVTGYCNGQYRTICRVLLNNGHLINIFDHNVVPA